MTKRIQSTGLRNNFGRLIDRLDIWTINPWRKYSLIVIAILTGFFIGSSIGMINGVLALMDPIGALWILVILEIMIRLRNYYIFSGKKTSLLFIIDYLRIGIIYGLISEGFKLF